MKKFDDIPKKTPFEVPEGYFDRLPGIIQSRVAAPMARERWSPFQRVTLRYALPAVAIAVAALFLLRGPQSKSAEDLLAGIDSEQLAAYLDETDISTEDLLETVTLDETDAQDIETNSLNDLELDDTDIDQLLLEMEIDSNDTK